MAASKLSAALLMTFALAAGAAPLDWRLSGPGGGGWIESLAWDPHDKDVLYVGCDVGGFYYSSNAGRTYQIRNEGLHDYFIEAIAVHPRQRGLILLGTEAGIHRSTDAGLHWQWIRDGFPKLEKYRFSAPIGALVFDRQRPSTAWAGIGRPRWGAAKPGASPEAGFLWRSDDAGATWRRIDAARFPAGTIVSAIAANGSSILVASNQGVFRSTDDGAHWAASNDGLPHRYTEELAMAPSAPNVIYLTVRSTAGLGEAWNGGVFRSDDAGRTWRAVKGEGLPKRPLARAGSPLNLSSNPKELAVDPRNADVVYVGHRDWVTAGVYKSTDGGERWSAVVRRATNDTNIDYGWIREWGPSVESLAISPAAPGRVAFGTSGHVFVSDDAALTWQQRYGGTGLETTCVWRMQTDPARRNRVYYCYMDIGLFITDDGGRTFRRSREGMKNGGNAFAVAVDPAKPTTLWAATGWWNRNEGDICRSIDDGATWQVVGKPETGLPNARVVEILLDPKSPAAKRRLLALAVEHGVFESLDGGTSWHAVNGDLAPAAVKDPRGLLLDSADSRHLIVAAPRALYETRDGGAHWTTIGSTALPFTITRLVASSKGPSTLYAAARDGFDAATKTALRGGAFRSDDGGLTWRQLYNFRHAADIAENPANPAVLYLATILNPYFDGAVAEGLLRSADGGTTWQAETKGLSNRNVKSIAISALDPATLYIGTGGNSAFVGRDGGIKTNQR